MELNRKGIVKALECQVGTDENHDCRGCYFYREGGLCVENMSHGLASCVLAFIRELDSLVRSMQNRIENQRVEIARLNKHIRSLEQSRDSWKDKAKRVGRQLYEVLRYHDDSQRDCNHEDERRRNDNGR